MTYVIQNIDWSNINAVRKYSREYRQKWMNKHPWMRNYWSCYLRCKNYKNYIQKGIKFYLTKEEVKELWFRDKAFEMNEPSIDRIDSNKDYIFCNCRFMERRENCGRNSRGMENKRAILNDDIVRKIKALSNIGLYPSKIAIKLNTKIHLVDNVVRGKSWKHIN